jgi:hypothetical protein
VSLLRNLTDRHSAKVAEPRRALCEAARLLSNIDFINLYGDDQSPVVARINDLERLVRDMSVTDPAQMIAYKAELHGLNFVRAALVTLAERQAAELGTAPAAEPRQGLLPVRPS